MSAVPFKNIPAGIRVPLFYAELDNSRANSASANLRALVIGQITAAGTATPGVPAISQGVGDAEVLGGPNSMLALMTAAYRLNDTFGEVWYLPLADNGAATAAAGSLAVTSSPTASGTLSLYLAGKLYPVPVLPTQTAAQIASAIVAALAADATCPVAAVVDAVTNTKVDLTAVNKGPCGNDIDIRLNYGGARNGEATPAGMAVTITPMSGGATPPDLTTPLANLGDTTFDFIALPYTDSTSLGEVAAFLNDTTGRWSWAQQLYGGALTAYRGTVGAQTTLGTGLNDQHTSVMGFYDSPTPNWIWAAALAGAAATSIRVDPALPLQTLALAGVLAPPVESRFALTDRNTLLYDGISTFTVDDSGTVRIENLITTYQKNAWGSPDNSYLEVETMYTLAAVLRQMRTAVTTKYARTKLAANGTRGPGIVTPNMIRAEIISEYKRMELNQGWVQNATAFAQALIVEQNAQNPNRVDVLWPGTLVDQLRIFAVLAQFRLQ
ncbi:MAG: phage tail sheath subtilisin-like domain-containing protein [Magnetospirillum sp.]|nr:phage tail sheath subtilisin-like domain-containing protein [Magnetospirillum sp.]